MAQNDTTSVHVVAGKVTDDNGKMRYAYGHMRRRYVPHVITSWFVGASIVVAMVSAAEDNIANKVFQECCQDIVNHINVDLVILPLHSKTWLTIQEFEHLQKNSTSEEKKRFLYINALSGKGSAAYKDILAILNDTGAHYKPHKDLVDILTNYHSRLSTQRVTRAHHDKYNQTQEDRTASVRARKETTLDSIQIQLGDDDDDVDQRTEYGSYPSYDQTQPSISTAQSMELSSLRLRTKQRVQTSAGNPSSSHVSSSFRYISDHATGQPVSSIKVLATSVPVLYW